MRLVAFLFALAAAVVAVMAMTAPPMEAPDRVPFEIATGSSSGTYFPIGQVLASLISHPPGVARCEDEGRCGPAGLIASARASEGSIANVRAVNEGRVKSGLAQADIVADAFEGRGVFKDDGKAESLRAIAALYPETVHIVVMANSPIKEIKDLRGKRVSIDAPGSGTNATARTILSAFKLNDKRVKFTYENAERSLELMKAGSLDAFFFVGGAPLGVVEQLAAEGKIRLLPVQGPEIDALVKDAPYLVKADIPEGTYQNMPPVPTIQVWAIWVVNANVPDDLVFALVRALFHPDNRSLLDSGHPKGKLIRLETARDGLPVPLHPGAERYYAGAAMPN
ncbi:MAG: TAXI family TRAP transporter solute-binding subunit [Alphaproteobacteria bacterium]|nr:TAXI family TRAP transporter solute-binding subunit [Alphaproteobacteria bacterium]